MYADSWPILTKDRGLLGSRVSRAIFETRPRVCSIAPAQTAQNSLVIEYPMSPRGAKFPALIRPRVGSVSRFHLLGGSRRCPLGRLEVDRRPNPCLHAPWHRPARIGVGVVLMPAPGFGGGPSYRAGSPRYRAVGSVWYRAGILRSVQSTQPMGSRKRTSAPNCTRRGRHYALSVITPPF